MTDGPKVVPMPAGVQTQLEQAAERLKRDRKALSEIYKVRADLLEELVERYVDNGHSRAEAERLAAIVINNK